MGLIILLIIVIGVIIFFRKKRNTKEKKELSTPVEISENTNSFSFFVDTEDKILAQKSKCQEFITTNEELTKIYTQVYDSFIPKPNGNYKSLSGVLDPAIRCKQLEKANEIVTRICNKDKNLYNVFFESLYDCIINDMITSKIKKLSNFANDIIEDFDSNTKIAEDLGFKTALKEFIENPDSEKHEIKTDIGSLFKKVNFIAERKKGKVSYKINNLYKYSPQGYNLSDPLVGVGEILITICDWYEYYDPSSKIKQIGPLKESLEKYNLPNSTW